MYGSFMVLITALCAAFSVGCLVLMVGRFLLEIDLSEKVENVPRRLPILVRLLLPFITVTRPLASGPSLAGWRDLVAPKLWMAGLGEMLSPADFVALRLVFLLVGIVLLGLGLVAGYFWMWALLALFAVKECLMLLWGYLTLKITDTINSAKWYGKLSTVVLYAVMMILILFVDIPEAKQLHLVGYTLVLKGRDLLENELQQKIKKSKYFSNDDDGSILDKYEQETEVLNLTSFEMRLKLKEPVKK